MKRIYLYIVCLCFSIVSYAQGDQILDGIGETGLIARYVLDGDVKDWSRNNWHAETAGVASFVADEQFKKVVSLSKGSYFTLPGAAVVGEESLSIAGWVYANTSEKNQQFITFETKSSSIIVYPTGINEQSGFVITIHTKKGKQYKITATEMPLEKWTHVAVVFNIPSKKIQVYLNGTLASEIQDIQLELTDVFNQNDSNLLTIGKSFSGKLSDIRCYRIPLSANQLERIYHNTLADGSVNEHEELEDDLPNFPEDQQQLYNTYLTAVTNVEVSTTVGTLPRLPRYVKGTYQNGIAGPLVRVLWPSPKDNSTVQKAGSYTITGKVAGTNFKPIATVHVLQEKVTYKPQESLASFRLEAVSLVLDTHQESTKFIENRDKFINTLANTNPDSFLYMFRNAFGQPQPKGAEPLGVWDTQETKLRGHATGHYLTAIAQAYASTGYDKALQENFKDKMEYMVNTLYTLAQLSGNPTEYHKNFVADATKVPPGKGRADFDSDLSEEGIRTDYWNWGKGYISAYPPDQFIMLEHGATYGGQPTQIWAPYYTLHKILAGLMDVYEVSGNEKALTVAEGMGNWVHARLSQLPTETLIKMWNRYIAGEFGGMNEAMARLYRLTGEKKYLETAKLFDNIKVFFGDAQHSHGLAKNVDTFRGLHANQHIPQIVGALEMYRDAAIVEYFAVADNFWYKTKNDYMYSIGGVAGARNPANAECFVAEPATLFENGFSSGGQNETCGTYNMLKLTRNLFMFDPKVEYMDYYERGLYNHILASVAKDSPANTYHVPLRPGSVKSFGNADMTGFTCCNGTAIESSTKLQNTIYFKSKDKKTLYINLYIPSTLHWEEQKVTIKQETTFPKEDETKITINGKGKFAVKVRVPQWATNGFFIKVNGKDQKVDALPGSYATLNRKWKKGDVISLKMPFSFHLEPIMDQQNVASLFYGPVLLAAQETSARTTWRSITLPKENIGTAIKRIGAGLDFTIDGVAFKPFYETYGRHSVYLDITLK
ncbi:Ig-like domain (group 4) [Pustulibacterium marinum]|uniref:Ig-like domain (Group 4) n=1 Tax=Pustulibacterium marinum TaxID=1224947 RepID=A0A1I7GWI7_9FLAO|nr:beta-L-arabinofuranosidase domain-containing protein [Pustulibacterium marinum]SFU52808.1 Ig-like domain (group 4) [Pustulibacterium marinum]